MQVLFRFKLKEILAEKGISQRGLMRMTGIDPKTMDNLCNRRVSHLNGKHAGILMQALGLKSVFDLVEVVVIYDPDETAPTEKELIAA